jgi:hypothetical protein
VAAEIQLLARGYATRCTVPQMPDAGKHPSPVYRWPGPAAQTTRAVQEACSLGQGERCGEGGSQMFPNFCVRLRNNVCIGILAGSLILSGAGCWAVWGPLIGVGVAGVGAAGGAAIVARRTRSTTPLSIAPAPDQTDAGRAPPASTPQIAFAVCRQNLLDKLAIDLIEDLVHLG